MPSGAYGRFPRAPGSGFHKRSRFFLWARELSIENSGLLQCTEGRILLAISDSIISQAYCPVDMHARPAAFSTCLKISVLRCKVSFVAGIVRMRR